MKAMYKYEVSDDTFRKWCRDHQDTLAALGCLPQSKLLNPAAVEFLCKKYCIVLEE